MNDNNPQQCGTKKCPVNCFFKLIIAAIPVALFLFAYDYVIHAKWLMDLYKQTPALWRTDEEMRALNPALCLGRLALVSLAITALYCKTKKARCANCAPTTGIKSCPIAHGLCFGVALGVLLGVNMASSYLWMPISAELGQKWFIAGLGEGIGAGLVLGLMCKICSKKSSSCGASSCGSKGA